VDKRAYLGHTDKEYGPPPESFPPPSVLGLGVGLFVCVVCVVFCGGFLCVFFLLLVGWVGFLVWFFLW